MRQQWLMWNKALSNDDVDALIKRLEEFPTQTAGVGEQGGNNTDIRRSTISWIKDPNISNDLWTVVQESNRIAFGFDVTSFCEVQYTKYFATENGHYDWHEDVLWESDRMYDRKLSVTVQLSDPDDYEGGEFQFKEGEQPPSTCREKGTILVFPSYLVHRVTPVTKGTRKSLVAWFEGPRWR